MISIDLALLPKIQFAEKDTAVIEREVISRFETAWEEATGEKLTLYPGDPRRFVLLAVVDELVQQRYLIDYAAKQNLLALADGGNLDHLAVLVGVSRLGARNAITTLEFALSAIQPSATTIPAGTRVSVNKGDVLFATMVTLEIPAGETKGQVKAACTNSGNAGNGFLPGQIRSLVDPLPWVQSVKNVTTTAGGSDVEGDENLRERTQLAPESFSVAGPRGSYESLAREAHQDIVDVAVVGPPETDPGNVLIYPLMKDGGLPTQDILDLVHETCDAEDVRPDTDHVFVLSPIPVAFDLSVSYWIDRARATQATTIQAAVEQAVRDWLSWQRSALGRDVNPSELNHRMVAAGAKRTETTSPEFTVLKYNEVAVPDEVSVVYGGLEDG